MVKIKKIGIIRSQVLNHKCGMDAVQRLNVGGRRITITSHKIESAPLETRSSIGMYNCAIQVIQERLKGSVRNTDRNKRLPTPTKHDILLYCAFYFITKIKIFEMKIEGLLSGSKIRIYRHGKRTRNRWKKPVTYIDVSYNDSDYTVGIIRKRESDEKLIFIIDREDKERVMKRNWHGFTKDSYIASSFTTSDGVKKSLSLHNFIMNKTEFEGRGSTFTVDHINGIGTDNRKENLREVSQSMQNFNTKQRKRTSDKFPEGIDPTEIPRNVWYIPACGSHSDRFAVEIKGIPDVGDVLWKTSSSKKKTIRDKLAEAVKKRSELFDTYPILKEYARTSEKAITLKKRIRRNKRNSRKNLNNLLAVMYFSNHHAKLQTCT